MPNIMIGGVHRFPVKQVVAWLENERGSTPNNALGERRGLPRPSESNGYAYSVPSPPIRSIGANAINSMADEYSLITPQRRKYTIEASKRANIGPPLVPPHSAPSGGAN